MPTETSIRRGRPNSETTRASRRNAEFGSAWEHDVAMSGANLPAADAGAACDRPRDADIPADTVHHQAMPVATAIAGKRGRNALRAALSRN